MRAYAIFEVTILGLIHAAAADTFKLKNKRNLEKCDHRWHRLGNDIKGKSCNLSGTAVSLSNDGKRVAIGAKADDKNKGSVLVYEWDKCEWKKLGKPIKEEYNTDPYDAVGGAVSISGDGNTVAVGVPANNGFKGSVNVYFYNKKKKWVKCGGIDGEKEYESVGVKNSVSMSDDGKTLAVGGSLAKIKIVQVKVKKGKKCTIKERASLKKGKGGGSVDLSGNGKMVAAGTSSGAGLVEFFILSGKTWEKCSYTFKGAGTYTEFGKSLALSVDGSRVVIGGSDGKNKGIVVVLEHVRDCKYEVNEAFEGEEDDDHLGGSVSISDDGMSIASGAFLNDGGGEQAGHVRLYTHEGDTWLNEDVDGLSYSRLGSSVSMSGNGKIVAIGAPGVPCNNDEVRIGYVEVMKFGECEDDLKIHRDPVKCTTEAPSKAPTRAPTNSPTKTKKNRRLGSVKTPKTRR